MYISLIRKCVVIIVGIKQEEETLKVTRLKREPVFIWVTPDLCFMLSKAEDNFVKGFGRYTASRVKCSFSNPKLSGWNPWCQQQPSTMFTVSGCLLRQFIWRHQRQGVNGFYVKILCKYFSSTLKYLLRTNFNFSVLCPDSVLVHSLWKDALIRSVSIQ